MKVTKKLYSSLINEFNFLSLCNVWYILVFKYFNG